MNTISIVKNTVFSAIMTSAFLLVGCSSEPAQPDIDLNTVLDITVETFHNYQETFDKEERSGELARRISNYDGEEVDQEAIKSRLSFIGLAEALSTSYNYAEPPLHTTKIGVVPQKDASLLAFEDTNADGQLEQGEKAIFLIEVDGDQQRVIATSGSGAVNEHHFSGSGLLTGYLIGSMLSRQRGAGVTPAQMASKKPVSARAAAKARAGSGSHAKGK